MIKTEFNYSEAEIKDFFKFHLTTKEKTKYIYYLSSLVFIGLGALLVFVLKERFLGLLLIVLAILLILLFPYQLNRTLNKQVHSRYKRPKQIITFSDEKIIQDLEDKTVEYFWDGIIEVNETKNYLYLYVSKSSALIVNKRTLDEAILKDLIALIKKHKGRITLYQNR
jgi:hypothetical protein